MKEIIQIINAWRKAMQQQQQVVLATVVHIEGSAYRAPGARMLVLENGALVGAVSGGCLEGDILRKAQLVMTRNEPLLVTYDTTDDDDAAGIGVSLGCNGIIRILLEPVTSSDSSLALLEKAISTREPVVVASFFTPEHPKCTRQGSYLVAVEQHSKHTVDDVLPVAYNRLQPDIGQVMCVRASAFVTYAPIKQEDETYIAFLEYIHPAPALVIAGAGNDVLPLVQLAAVLGWETTLVDGRPAYASNARFPSCRISIASVENPLRSITIDSLTAVLLMTHNFHYDKAVLKQAINSAAPYIGLLGPAKKRDRLLQELKEEGVTLSKEQERRIYGPTGLDIGAETPEEIALSIVSEIKAVFAQRPGHLLRSQQGSIHHRNTRIADPLATYAILVLAAGQSKRLGQPKQQLLYNGDTLLRNTVQTASALHAGVTIVVAGSDTENIQQQLADMPATVISNPAYAAGISSSIRTGIQYLQEQRPDVKYVLILLCDQPYLNSGHLRRLVHRQQTTGAAIVASRYAERNGVPAIFHQSLFPDLLALQGDTGPKYLIEAHGDTVERVNFPALATDVDNIEAYQQLVSAAHHTSDTHDYR